MAARPPAAGRTATALRRTSVRFQHGLPRRLEAMILLIVLADDDGDGPASAAIGRECSSQAGDGIEISPAARSRRWSILQRHGRHGELSRTYKGTCGEPAFRTSASPSRGVNNGGRCPPPRRDAKTPSMQRRWTRVCAGETLLPHQRHAARARLPEPGIADAETPLLPSPAGAHRGAVGAPESCRARALAKSRH